MNELARASRKKGLKGWLVEPYKQIKIGLIFLFVNLAFAVMFLLVFGYYLHDIHSNLVAYLPEQSDIIGSKLNVPLMVGGVLMVLFIATTLIVSVRYTHAIYGPLVSIHRYLDEFAAGKRMNTPLKLRDGDQLQSLAEKINKAIESLRKNS